MAEDPLRGLLNNVAHVRVPYFQAIAMLPEDELAYEMVRLCAKLRDLTKGTELEKKLAAAMHAIEVVE